MLNPSNPYNGEWVYLHARRKARSVTFAGCAELLPHSFCCLRRGCFLTVGELALKRKKTAHDWQCWMQKPTTRVAGPNPRGCDLWRRRSLACARSYLSSRFPPCPACPCLRWDRHPCSRLLPPWVPRSSRRGRGLPVSPAPVSWLRRCRPRCPFSPGRASAADPSRQSSPQGTGLVSSGAPTPDKQITANHQRRHARGGCSPCFYSSLLNE